MRPLVPRAEAPGASLECRGRVCASSSSNAHLRYLLPAREPQRGAVALPRKQGRWGPSCPPCTGAVAGPSHPCGPVIRSHRDLLATDSHSLRFAECVSSLGRTLLWLLRLNTSKRVVSSLEEPQPQPCTQPVATPRSPGLPLPRLPGPWWSCVAWLLFASPGRRAQP